MKIYVYKIENGIVENIGKEKYLSQFKEEIQEEKWNSIRQRFLKNIKIQQYQDAKYIYYSEGDIKYVFGAGLSEDLIQEMLDIKIYYLMHKNIQCAKIYVKKNYQIEKVEYLNTEHLPYSFKNTRLNKKDSMISWFYNRSIPKNRKYYDRIKINLKNMSVIEIIFKCKALRLTDCYWLKEQGSADTWENVNFFNNFTSTILDRIYILSEEFNDNIKIDEETLLTPNATTEGSLPKIWRKEEGIWKLYKANERYNEGDNEVIWSKILDYVGIDHIKYYLGELTLKIGNEMQTNVYSVCENYCNENKEFISAYDLIFAYKQRKDKNDVVLFEEFCKSKGLQNIEKFISDQLIMDYILANTDRHWHNFGIIRNPDTLKFIETMPIYDNGNSLWYKTRSNDRFVDPNLNFSERKKNGETTKQCLRYVSDWSLLNNEKIYDIPKIYKKCRLDIDKGYEERRLEQEIRMITEHIEFLKKVKKYSYEEIIKQESIQRYK